MSAPDPERSSLFELSTRDWCDPLVSRLLTAHRSRLSTHNSGLAHLEGDRDEIDAFLDVLRLRLSPRWKQALLVRSSTSEADRLNAPLMTTFLAFEPCGTKIAAKTLSSSVSAY